MESRALILARWHAGRVWRRLGWDLAAGLLVALLALVLAWKSWLLAEDTRSLRAMREQLDSRARPLAADAGATETARQLEAFYARLPAQDEIATRVKALLALAGKSGVQLAHGEYHPVVDSAARLIRYQMIFPVRGEASRVQGFVLDALNGEPALVLDGISFRRDSVQSGEVETRLRLTLLARLP